jgi:predicted Zn-dependent protease
MRALSVVAVSVIVMLAVGCATNPVSGRSELTLVSVAEEKKLGEQEAKKVETQIGLFDDARLTAYFETLGQRLARESPRQDVTYRFRVVDMVEPNAFALPGGYVYVSRGLLALVNNEDELAGVVGHEIAHVAARHSVQKISKQGPVAAVFGVFSGLTNWIPVVGGVVEGIGDVTQSLIFAPYDRSQETQADQVGQDVAAKAGWDPAGLSRFLTTLGREVDLTTKGARRPSFFDSHPPAPDRVAKTAAHARTVKRADRPPISASHEEFLARLDGLVVGQRAANGLITGRTFAHPDFGIFIQFPERWELENTRRKVMAVAPDREAAIVLSAVAEGNDPMEGARALDRATKSSVSSRTRRTTINGLPAAHTRIEVEGKVGLDFTWIAHGGLVFQVAGLAPLQRFAGAQPAFTATGSSFRPLTAAERAGIKEQRIRIVKARAGETLDALARRTSSAWRTEEIAVANGLAVGTPLAEGQLIKVTNVQPYEPQKGR